MQDTASNENRILAALGYPIWIVALIVLLGDMKRNPFMRTHAIQALGYNIALAVIAIGLGIVTSLPGMWRLAFLESFVYLGWFALALFYGYRAHQGQTFSIPVVSQFTARYSAEKSA